VKETQVLEKSLRVQSILSAQAAAVPIISAVFTFLAMTLTNQDITVTQVSSLAYRKRICIFNITANWIKYIYHVSIITTQSITLHGLMLLSSVNFSKHLFFGKYLFLLLKVVTSFDLIWYFGI